MLNIHTQLMELASQAATLKKLSPDAALAARSAEVTLKEAIDQLRPDPNSGDAGSIAKRLIETTSFLKSFLDAAKSLADKTGDTGKLTESLIERAAQLVNKLYVASLWLERL